MKETELFIAGNFAGAMAAIETLARACDKSGAINLPDYVAALKATFNQPEADHSRPDYDFLRRLAVRLEK